MVERNTELMSDYNAKVAPFIKKTFYVTAQAGKYPSGDYHSGIDLSTGTGTRGANLYSICSGTVIDVGYQSNGYGNYIIIKDNDSKWAFLFGHLADTPLKNKNDKINLGEQFGVEGATGNVTGLHVHVEMEDYINNGNKWIFNSSDESLWDVVYFNPSEYMGFPNLLGISVYYDGNYNPIIKKSNASKWLKMRAKKVVINT